MLGLKLNHVSKRGHRWSRLVTWRLMPLRISRQVWLCGINIYLPSKRKDWNYPRHSSVEKWQKTQIYFMFPITFSTQTFSYEKLVLSCIISMLIQLNPDFITPLITGKINPRQCHKEQGYMPTQYPATLKKRVVLMPILMAMLASR